MIRISKIIALALALYLVSPSSMSRERFVYQLPKEGYPIREFVDNPFQQLSREKLLEILPDLTDDQLRQLKAIRRFGYEFRVTDSCFFEADSECRKYPGKYLNVTRITEYSIDSEVKSASSIFNDYFKGGCSTFDPVSVTTVSGNKSINFEAKTTYKKRWCAGGSSGEICRADIRIPYSINLNTTKPIFPLTRESVGSYSVSQVGGAGDVSASCLNGLINPDTLVGDILRLLVKYSGTLVDPLNLSEWRDESALASYSSGFDFHGLNSVVSGTNFNQIVNDNFLGFIMAIDSDRTSFLFRNDEFQISEISITDCPFQQANGLIADACYNFYHGHVESLKSLNSEPVSFAPGEKKRFDSLAVERYGNKSFWRPLAFYNQSYNSVHINKNKAVVVPPLWQLYRDCCSK